jgi:UDP-3-O-[3-hydroxymyristoyl] glucosamine N-acyltransferase
VLAAELGRAVDGDADCAVDGVASLAEAGPSDLAWAGPGYTAELRASRAGAVVAPPGLDTGGRPTIRSPHPRLDFARAVRRILPRQAPDPGVHPGARVAADARIDASASLGPGCCIGAGSEVGARSVLHANVTLYDGVRVGADCVLHSGCVLREGTTLGDRVVLQPGVVLGGDGFGYALNERGAYEAVPQVGRVVLEDDVEVGANTTIDRGALGETRIARGAKLDNLVMIAHNVRVGEDVLIVAQAGLAGSVRVGRGALVMAQAGVSDHAEIGERAYVGPQTGVSGDVAPGARVLGTPHGDLARTRRVFALWRRLPELLRRIRALERRLGMAGEREGDAPGGGGPGAAP